MKNINKVFNAITVSLLILILMGVCGTFLSDYLASINWFGDYKITHDLYYGQKNVTREYWGARHYWYNWGCSLLFVSGVARCTVKVINIIDNNSK